MLSRCIAVDAPEFAAAYWGRRPLLSRADRLPGDFGDLLSAAAVDELIAERGVRAPFIRVARDGEILSRSCYLGSGGFGAEMPDQVDSAKLLAAFASGATIVLQGLHRLWPPLIDFVRDVVDDIGHPVQANAYVTPPTGVGFDAHYDVHDVFVLQTGGSKRWIVHEPVVRHPLESQPWTRHRAAIAERVCEDPVIDTVLAEGDALYLPRGWLHSARALDSTSIHLSIGVAPLTGVDVARAIVDELSSIESLRGSMPLGIAPSDRDETISVATKVMAQLADVLRDEAATLSERTAATLEARFAARTRPAAVRPLESLAASVDASGPVRWRRGLVSSMERLAHGGVELRLPDKTITFPATCALALRALRDGRVVGGDPLPGLDAADTAVLVRRLLREAVVVPAGITPPDTVG